MEKSVPGSSSLPWSWFSCQGAGISAGTPVSQVGSEASLGYSTALLLRSSSVKHGQFAVQGLCEHHSGTGVGDPGSAHADTSVWYSGE